MKKPKVINLELQTVHVETKVRKLRDGLTWEIGELRFDCCDDKCAQFWGFASRDEYRRKMNSKQGYKDVIKMMGK
jgi:hypothetical protein